MKLPWLPINFGIAQLGKRSAALLGQIIELIFCDRGLERAFRIRTPVGNQPVKSDRIDHRSREDMRADRRALFHDDDRDFGIQFLEPDRRGQARRPRADDHDIVIHRFPRGQCRILGHDPFCHSRLGAQHFMSSLSLGQPASRAGARSKAQYDSLSSRGRASIEVGTDQMPSTCDFKPASLAWPRRRFAGGFGPASPRRSTRQRMTVSPRAPARTETGATRRTCRYAKPRQRLPGKPR